METHRNYSLRSLTTLQVEARAARYVRFGTESEIVGFLQNRTLGDGRHLVLGGGSNLLFVGDFDGLVLHPALKGVAVSQPDDATVQIRAMAGENWDDLVALTVARGWGGLENLSLIPGSVGACAVQNIGAYGVEAADCIHRVEVVALADGKRQTLSAGQCGFGYRHSRFKGRWKNRYVITAVVFRVQRRPTGCVTHYPAVARALHGAGPPTPAGLRRVIVDLRRRRLPDPARLGNAGSFFKNPTLAPVRFEDLAGRFTGLPGHRQDDGRVKVPAGWLIERCGWKGRCLGRAAVYERHALVLVNRGGATGREIYELSQRIQRSVRDTFGIDLEREVQVVL